MNPDVVLTSSKADDGFIDAVNEHSTRHPECVIICGDLSLAVESTDSTFQIRPFKEFMSSKGRDRLLSLKHFSKLAVDEPTDIHSSDTNSNSSRPNNAYGFMRSRRDAAGDPSTARWNASIRLSNFASVETSPLCVC